MHPIRILFNYEIIKNNDAQGVLNTWHLVLFQRLYASLNHRLGAKFNHLRRVAGAKAPAFPAAPTGLDSSPLLNTPVESFIRPRILVCAPSNAATDELLERLLKDGFVDLNGNPYKPSVLRIGSEASKDANLSIDAQQVCVTCLRSSYVATASIWTLAPPRANTSEFKLLETTPRANVSVTFSGCFFHSCTTCAQHIHVHNIYFDPLVLLA